MLKPHIRILIPLLLLASLISYTWMSFLFGLSLPVLQHYIGLILFIPLLYFFFVSFKKAILFTGLYLVIGTFNLLSLTPTVKSTSYFVKLGAVEIGTPSVQPLALVILVLYFVLNFNQLANYYLDFKEARANKKKG